MGARHKAALKPMQRKSAEPPARALKNETPDRKRAPPLLTVAGGGDVIRRRCACGGGGCASCGAKREKLQPRVEIGPEGDELEIEAERMADRVVAAAAGAASPAAPADSNGGEGSPGGSGRAEGSGGTHGSGASGPLSHGSPSSSPSIRTRVRHATAFRRCACGGSCSRCQSDEEPRARRAPETSGTFGTGESGALHPRALGAGRALPADTRRFMEAQFDAGFEGVRIHDDGPAADAARSIHAQAYTIGTDIVFGAGRFAPTTRHGLHLLAHELTHVVQQGSAGARAAGSDISRSAAHRSIAQRSVPAPNEPGECPPVPTGLGRQAPDPATPRASHAGTTLIGRWHFCLDSNTLVADESLETIPRLIARRSERTRYLVHGHASTDGDATYNENLAGHRANVVGDALKAALTVKLGATPGFSPALLTDLTEVATRGETAEFGSDLAANRVVLLYAEVPGRTVTEEPSCEDAPRRIGNVPFEVPCDEPTKNLAGRGSERNVAHFRFCMDSDVFTDPAREIGRFAGRHASNAVYTVHGFASEEDSAAYNLSLSCHRAMRVARELMNAGVRSTQIREVAGIGETNAFSFGDEEFIEANRVAVVLAEDADIEALEDSARPAETDSQKRAIIDEARSRIQRGQYRSEADFYISKWTCGRTPTVAAAVTRLMVGLRDGGQRNDNERRRDPANGIEEDVTRGPGGVVMSNAALRATNPVECVMGRLIDMSFHHAVIGEDQMSPALTAERPARGAFEPAVPPSLRHLAGLHLISLAGMQACEGSIPNPAGSTEREPLGVDHPELDDPLTSVRLPECATSPQPTRALAPMPGDERRTPMRFLPSGDAPQLLSGNLTETRRGRASLPDGARGATALFTTGSDVMQAKANVDLIGQPEHFDDYEVGFIQNIVQDELNAEYADGRRIIQKLPLPIRAAHLRGEARAPAPWLGTNAKDTPDSGGHVKLDARWRMGSDFALTINVFQPRDETVLLDTWTRHTRINLWVVARRRGMPLDRFSVAPIDGSVYDLEQTMDLHNQRLRGDMMRHETDKTFLLDTNARPPEREVFDFRSAFHATSVSDVPEGLQLAQFDQPVSSEIDLFRQFQRIVEAPPAPTPANGGMSQREFIATATRILDTMQDFNQAADGTASGAAVADPRVGFRGAALDVLIRVDPRTGRLLPLGDADKPAQSVEITSPGLGVRARYHLSRALALRMQKRDFLGTGKPVILGSPPANGVVRFHLEPHRADENLLDIPGVKDDMKVMWACSMFTRNSPDFLCPREFAMTYTRDRNGAVHRRAFQSKPSPDCEEKIQTDIDCSTNSEKNADKMAIGAFHTHPLQEPNSDKPSGGDIASERATPGACGGQLFIVSDDFITAYDRNGVKKDSKGRDQRMDREKTIGNQGTKCPFDITPDQIVEVI